jgi:thiol-disulfide isomerase/thioredoxin
MFRRNFLALLTVAGIALAVPAFAQNGGVPGLDDALKTGEPFMIHVTAPWCGTCQAQNPIVAALLASSDFKNVRAFEVDFDTQKDVLARYRVQSQSTMIILRDGKEVDRQVGQTDPGVIETLLRKAL